MSLFITQYDTPVVANVRRFAYDASGNLEYEGWAALPGSLTSAAVWCIRKHTYDASNRLTLSQYADGNTAFDNVWDDRATLTYA